MGAPKLNPETSNNVPMTSKKVQIAGFTEGLRQDELERVKKKLEKSEWTLSEYFDDGFSKSFAIFKRPTHIKDPVNLKPFLTFVGIIAVGWVLNIVKSPSQNTEVDKASQDELNISALVQTYNDLDHAHLELIKTVNAELPEFETNGNKMTKEQDVRWGRWSHVWNKNLKEIRSRSILKNPGMLNLKTTIDRAKNSTELYGSELLLLWQLLNDKMSGRKFNPEDYEIVEKDTNEAYLAAKKALKELGVKSSDK